MRPRTPRYIPSTGCRAAWRDRSRRRSTISWDSAGPAGSWRSSGHVLSGRGAATHDEPRPPEMGAAARWRSAWDRGLAPDDLAGLDTRRAHLHFAGRAAAGRRAHGLDVRVPAAVGPAVRVGHVVAEARLLVADLAHGSHGNLLVD